MSLRLRSRTPRAPRKTPVLKRHNDSPVVRRAVQLHPQGSTARYVPQHAFHCVAQRRAVYATACTPDDDPTAHAGTDICIVCAASADSRLVPGSAAIAVLLGTPRYGIISREPARSSLATCMSAEPRRHFSASSPVAVGPSHACGARTAAALASSRLLLPCKSSGLQVTNETLCECFTQKF